MISACANGNVPMQIVMDWLGHQDSRMVRYYYHLADQRTQDEMKRLTFVNTPPVKDPPYDAAVGV